MSRNQQSLFDAEPEAWEVDEAELRTVASVVLPTGPKGPFDYLVPESLANPVDVEQFVEPGRRVRVPFGRGDRSVVGKAWFGRLAEGPPGHAHGGAIAAVLDEAMGAAAWLNGHPVVAAELATRFHALVPLSTVACFEASLASVEGRKVRTHAVLRGPHGVAYATAEALFIVLAAERFGEGARALLARATARSPR